MFSLKYSREYMVREIWTWDRLLSLEDTLDYLRDRWFWFKFNRKHPIN